MLLLLDLDNTLVNRSLAFEQWVIAVVEEYGGGAKDVEWLIQKDANGYAPRVEVAEAMKSRFRRLESSASIVDRLMSEHVDFIECYAGVVNQLSHLRAHGTKLVVVTNGSVRQQTMKIERTGLGAILDAAVISESVGVKKPDAAIFRAALRLHREAGIVWMVGDHPKADVAGARAVGISTGWVSHGAKWQETWTPDVIGLTTVDILFRIGMDLDA